MKGVAKIGTSRWGAAHITLIANKDNEFLIVLFGRGSLGISKENVRIIVWS